MIRNNRGRKEKALWTEKGAGSRIHFRQFDNAYEEAEYIADDIEDKVKKDGIAYADCAVLYRTNAQSRLLEERMVVEGIPYHVVGGVNFYARQEIRDILAYLKTIDNGRDEVALRRIINVPKRSIGAASLDKVADYAQMKEITLFDALCEADQIKGLGRAENKIKGFVNLIRVLRSGLSSYTLPDLIKALLENIEYAEYLRDQDEESAEDRLGNVDELITKAAVYEETHDEPNLSEFLEEIMEKMRYVPGKVDYALANGGFDWDENGGIASLTTEQAEAEAVQYQAEVIRDEASGVNHFEYEDENQDCHEVWYGDDETLQIWMGWLQSGDNWNYSIWRLGK